MSKSNDKDKKLKAWLVFFLVVIMSIIFAAISSNLIVELKLMNGSNSDGNKLNVAFSNTISLDGSREIYGYPSKYTTSPATIKNLENPMIVGLNAHFTEPGQSVTYSFYILNSGAYDAFLQEIIYGTLDSNGQFKSCSTKGLDDNRMDVCNFIDVSLDIGTDLNKVKANDSKYVSDHILKKGTYEPISVTISYSKDAKPVNEHIYITFANIYLKYSQLKSGN